jgi:tetraacyldisaccharide 4'-kinase
MREPAFWWRAPAAAARLLAPLAALYGAVARRRLSRPGRRAAVPVVCVGNLTVGGAGKTPAALAVARLLAAAGERPAFLTRGYGGTLAGPLLVDPATHRADEVGDEPLLLARAAPTVVARDRAAGADAAIAAGASVVVMDDGFQNPALAKDFSVLVIDGRRGIGNARMIPAGPLRAPLGAQLARAHALVVVGRSTGAETIVVEARARGLAVFAARLEPDAGALAALRGARVLAFAGIGDPGKFFGTLADADVAVAATRSFPDHHRYRRDELAALRSAAARDGLLLLTTEKDRARLDERVLPVAVLPVMLAFADEGAFKSLLLERIRSRTERRMG